MTEPREPYSPERRTALLFTGTGADGAYHAGVLRALYECGVKVDIVGGRGIGALAAVLAAIDGGAQLWEAGGFWRRGRTAAFYRWRWPYRVLTWLLVAAAAVVAAPPALVVAGLAVYPVALLLGMAGLDAGAALVEQSLDLLARAFAPTALPTWVPRLVTGLVSIALVVLSVGAGLAWRSAPVRRRTAGSRAWALLGAPLDASAVIDDAIDAVWRLLRGGASLRAPRAPDLSRRYAEVLADGLGAPGVRELLLVVHDLDARRDLVFGLLREPYRRALFPPPGGVSLRRADAHDLGAGTQALMADALAAALSLPGVTEPRLARFAPDAYWRGEAHRLIDRPAAVGRLVEEAAAAGAAQLILVSASPEPPGPHELARPRVDGWGRISEYLASAEAAALGDALRHLHHRFQGVYVIRPQHNPVRPLDLAGAFDERSDRVQTLEELMERGYEDAYRQFIEPVLGAAGERIGTERHH